LLLFNKMYFKACLVLLYFSFFSVSSYGQSKKLTPKKIQQFIKLIEDNAMPISEHIGNSKDFSTFVKTLKLTNEFETLTSKDEYTVFAPSNDAFQQFPIEVITELFQPKNLKKLHSIVTYHIVKGKLQVSDIIDAIDKNGEKETQIKTINGLVLTAYYDEGSIFIKDDNGYSIKVISQNGIVSNGLIYRIDTVILPQVDNDSEKNEK